MVGGIAIDKAEDNKYKVSAEIINMQEAQGEGPTSQVVFSEGETMFSALKSINSSSREELYFSHATVVIISEEVAREGLISIIDLIIRDDQLRITNDVIIAKGIKAASLFDAKGTGEPIISYEISSALENESKTVSMVPQVKVYELINIVGSSGVSAVLPAFSLKDEVLHLDGTAYFHEDKLKGFLSASDSAIMTIIQGETKEGFITQHIKTDTNEYLTAEVFSLKTKVNHSEKGGKITMNIDVLADVGIGELTTKENLMTPSGRNKIEKKLEKNLEDNIYKLIRTMKSKGNIDIFGFGERIYKEDPKLWKKIHNTDYFKNLSIKVKVKTNLRSTGFIAKSPSSEDFRLKDVE